MQANARDITINRLTVKGSRRDTHLLANNFETQSWLDTDSKEWLFIRKLNVKGPVGDLRQQTSQFLTEARCYAVDGSSSAAEQANAVRFPSLPAMIGFLLRDITDGSAVNRWYWERWKPLLQQPKGTAAARLLWEHTEYLPEIVNQWSEQQLETIWLTLDSDSATSIANKLTTSLDYLHSNTEANLTHKNFGNTIRDSSRHENTDQCNTAQDNEPVYAEIIRSVHHLPMVLLRWSRIFRQLPAVDGRVKLAATLTGIQHFPLLLAQYPQQLHDVLYSSAINLNRFFGMLEQDTTRSPQQRVKTKRSSPTNDRNNKIYEIDVAQQTQQDSNNTQQPTERTYAVSTNKQSCPNSASSSPADTDKNPLSKNLANKNEQHHSKQLIDTTGEHDVIAEAQHHSRIHQIFDGQFYTDLGGIFYLLNVLIPYVEKLQTATNTTSPGIGFRWLFELARRFPEADENSHKIRLIQQTLLLEYLTQQMGFENSEALSVSTALPVFDEIFELLQQKYSDIWNHTLLECPATVLFTSSHIDVLLPINAIRVEVRLYGLDVNPGWQPWLGRVVHFHYRQSIDVQDY